MAANALVQTRIDGAVKEEAATVLAAMGLTVSDAVRLLFHRIIADQAFPLELKVPNSATRAAMAEADDLLAKRDARFADGEALIADLDG